MARLSGIVQADPVSYTARMGSESVTVVFDQAKMNGYWEKAIRQAIAADDSDTVASKLFSVFISWDVEDDAGAPVPISEEILLSIPGKAVKALFEGMQKAIGPSDAEGNAFANTSSSGSDVSSSTPESPLNGQPTSPTPEPVASPSLTQPV